MIKSLLLTTTVSILSLSPGFCMNSFDSLPKAQTLCRQLSSCFQRSREQTEDKEQLIKKQSSPKKQTLCRQLSSCFQCSKEQTEDEDQLIKKQSLEEAEELYKRWQENIDKADKTNTVTYQQTLKKAIPYFKKAAKLGYKPANFAHALALVDLSKIDTQYQGPETENLIGILLMKADSEEAAVYRALVR